MELMSTNSIKYNDVKIMQPGLFRYQGSMTISHRHYTVSIGSLCVTGLSTRSWLSPTSLCMIKDPCISGIYCHGTLLYVIWDQATSTVWMSLPGAWSHSAHVGLSMRHLAYGIRFSRLNSREKLTLNTSSLVLRLACLNWLILVKCVWMYVLNSLIAQVSNSIETCALQM